MKNEFDFTEKENVAELYTWTLSTHFNERRQFQKQENCYKVVDEFRK